MVEVYSLLREVRVSTHQINKGRSRQVFSISSTSRPGQAHTLIAGNTIGGVIDSHVNMHHASVAQL
jgi:hypothetical protein